MNTRTSRNVPTNILGIKSQNRFLILFRQIQMITRLFLCPRWERLIQQPSQNNLCPFSRFGVIILAFQHTIQRVPKRLIKRPITGDKGSYATFHSQSTQEALVRMQSMGIPAMDLSSIDLVLVQKRWTRVDSRTGFRSEERKIVELSELDWSNNQLEPRALMEFDFKQEKWLHWNASQRTAAKIRRTFGFGEKELEEEMENRRQFLESRSRHPTDLKEFFGLVNQC